MAAKKKQKKTAPKSVKKVSKLAKAEEHDVAELKKPTPGVYVYKPLKSKIVECGCGNKYIVTRPRQKMCLDCVKEETLASAS